MKILNKKEKVCVLIASFLLCVSTKMCAFDTVIDRQCEIRDFEEAPSFVDENVEKGFALELFGDNCGNSSMENKSRVISLSNDQMRELMKSFWMKINEDAKLKIISGLKIGIPLVFCDTNIGESLAIYQNSFGAVIEHNKYIPNKSKRSMLFKLNSESFSILIKKIFNCQEKLQSDDKLPVKLEENKNSVVDLNGQKWYHVAGDVAKCIIETSGNVACAVIPALPKIVDALPKIVDGAAKIAPFFLQYKELEQNAELPWYKFIIVNVCSIAKIPFTFAGNYGGYVVDGIRALMGKS